MRLPWQWLLTITSFASLSQAHASSWNMPVGVTDTSRNIFGLHMTIFWVCVVIGVIVFGVMFYSLFRYRHSKGAKAARFHEHTSVEVLWTAIPILILVGMAVPATATLKNMYDASEADLDIMITGQQWRWRYEYLGGHCLYLELKPHTRTDSRRIRSRRALFA